MELIDQIRRPIQNRIDELETELEKLRGIMKALGGGWVGNRTNGRAGRPAKNGKATTKRRGGRRPRRSPEQMAAAATAVFAMIKKAGDDGIGGGEIRKAHPRIGPNVNIKEFVEKFTDHKVRQKGEARATTYVAAE